MPKSARLLPVLSFVLLLGVLLFGTACSKVPLGVYRVDVQQGNVLSEDMLAELSPGMEKRKVRFLLGTPILVDTFNQDRWDYIYTYSRGTGRVEQRLVTLFFEDDRLERIEGDVHRSAGRREVTRGETLVLVPEEERSEGLLGTIESGLELLRPDSEADDGEAAMPASETHSESSAETSEGTPQSEEVAHVDAEVEPSAAPAAGLEEEEEEGWLENVLQYLKPVATSPEGGDSGPPTGDGESRQ